MVELLKGIIAQYEAKKLELVNKEYTVYEHKNHTDDYIEIRIIDGVINAMRELLIKELEKGV